MKKVSQLKTGFIEFERPLNLEGKSVSAIFFTQKDYEDDGFVHSMSNYIVYLLGCEKWFQSGNKMIGKSEWKEVATGDVYPTNAKHIKKWCSDSVGDGFDFTVYKFGEPLKYTKNEVDEDYFITSQEYVDKCKKDLSFIRREYNITKKEK